MRTANYATKSKPAPKPDQKSQLPRDPTSDDIYDERRYREMTRGF